LLKEFEMPDIVGVVEAVAKVVVEELEPAAAAAKGGDTNLLSLMAQQADHKVGTSLAESELAASSSAALSDGRVAAILRDNSLASGKMPPIVLEGATTSPGADAGMKAASSAKEAEVAPWAHPLRKSYGFDQLL
jgi:hypothetical protein